MIQKNLCLLMSVSFTNILLFVYIIGIDIYISMVAETKLENFQSIFSEQKRINSSSKVALLYIFLDPTIQQQ